MRGFDLTDYDFLDSHSSSNESSLKGATVTPGNNTMGSWATVLSTALVGDYHGIEIVAHSFAASTLAKDGLLDFGWDPAGGTNYGASALTIIPYLMVSYAGLYGGMPGVRYYFPLLIPSGSTLGARAQVNNATVGTGLVFARLWKARRPMDAVFGTQVLSYGEDTANSRGTAVTMGQASIGSYTQIGSSLAAPAPWYWNVAHAVSNNSNQAAAVTSIDLAFGDGTTKDNVLRQFSFASTTEDRSEDCVGVIAPRASGDNIYVRGWTEATGSQTSYTAMVHGMVG